MLFIRSIANFEVHRKYTAFQSVDGQIFQWKALSFSLASAPATFSILMATCTLGHDWCVCTKLFRRHFNLH